MNNWTRLVWLIIAVIVVVVLMGTFLKYQPNPPQEQQKTFYDVIQEDDKRLRADVNEPQQPAAEQTQQQYEELTTTQQVEAERLFEMALAQRKMGRLPGMTYKQMVDYCREIIEKFPKSSYAAKARRILADIPEKDRQLYNITDEEINPPK